MRPGTRRRIRVPLLVLTLLLTFQSVFSADYYTPSARALVTVAKPNVNLQAGNYGNSTIYVNGTSAKVTTPTLNYPTGYNVVTGTYVSGTTPGSVNAADTNYFQVSSVVSSTGSSAFKDGTSVTVPTAIAAVDSITTTLAAGNNLVIVAVQFDNTATAARLIAAGNLEVRRGTNTTDSLVSETTFAIRIAANAAAGDGMFAMLIGTDASAPANPTYGLFAAADLTGINAEVKFVVINGLAAANYSFGDGVSTSLQSSTTTLRTQNTTLPAASVSLPNIIIATIQYDSVSGVLVRIAGSGRIMRGATAIATAQYAMELPNNGSPDGAYDLLVGIDTAAPVNATYTVDSLNDDSVNTVNGQAKILIFRGFAANRVDTGSVAMGTARTVIGSITTTFAAGDDVLLGAIQLDAVGATRTIAANADDIRKTSVTGASSNEFAHRVAVTTSTGGGQFQAFVRKVTTGANPSYEGAATAPAASSLNAELKLVAIHVADAPVSPVETEFTFAVSSSTPLQLNLTVVQQYTIGSATVTIQVYNYSGAAYPTTGQGYLTYTSSATPSTDETKTLAITTNPQHYTSGGAAKIKIKGNATANLDQKANLVRLYYYQTTYDYVLKIVNQQATAYDIRLNSQGLTQSNIGRLTNFTAWFHDGSSSVQLQILSGSFSTQTGSLYSLGASAIAYIAVRVTASSSGVSTIDCVLQTYNLGGNSHTDYRLTFNLT